MTDAHDADPLVLALAFAQLFLEVECGRRPGTTLEPLMTPRLTERAHPSWVRGGALRRPGAARGSFSAPDCFEAAVVARGPERLGVLALRLERRAGGWRVSEIARPEDGELPEPEAPAVVAPPAACSDPPDEPDEPDEPDHIDRGEEPSPFLPILTRWPVPAAAGL